MIIKEFTLKFGVPFTIEDFEIWKNSLQEHTYVKRYYTNKNNLITCCVIGIRGE